MKLANTGIQAKDSIVGGRISRQEIEKVTPVIERILMQSDITLDHPVTESFLGSSGSNRLICGDIDIAVPIQALNHGTKLAAHPDVKSCSQHGNVISLVIEIPGGEISESQLRNGLVQVDLIGGNSRWLKQFYYSDSKSSFKGAHRNLLISAYLAHFRTKKFTPDWGDMWVTDEGPIFSQKNGLCDRHRTRVAKGDGTPYASKFITIATNHSFNLSNSATHHFGSSYAHAFNSFEDLVRSIEEYYDDEYIESIYTCFFTKYINGLSHLNTDAFPWWTLSPRLNAIRLKTLQE